MDAADHRALPGGSPGRRTGRLPSRSSTCWPTSSGWIPAPNCRFWNARSSARIPSSPSRQPPPRSRRPEIWAGSPARCSAGPPIWPRSAGWSRRTGWSPWSARPGWERPGWRSRSPGTADRSDGRWLVRLENARTAASVWQGVGEAFDVAGATEAMVLDRLRGLDLLLVLDNCEQLVEVLPDLLERMLSAAPRLRVLATSQLRLGVDGEAVYSLDPLAITRCGRAVLRAGESAAAVVPDGRGHRPGDRGGVPFARRTAAGHRTGRRAGQGAVGRGDRPAARRSVHPAQRSDQPPAGAPADPSGRPGLELRPAVPR